MLTFLVALVPSAGALFLFWVALRAILQADRRERMAVARYDAEQARVAVEQTLPEGAPGAPPPAPRAPGPTVAGESAAFLDEENRPDPGVRGS